MFVSAFASLILSVRPTLLMTDPYKFMANQISYRNDNKKRDRLYGRPDLNAKVDVSELADKVKTIDLPISTV